MANKEQINQELEALQNKFMLLDTDEERSAFRAEVEAFANSKSKKKNCWLVKLLLKGRMRLV